ncbi:hypothetical protein Pelo_742 [Pelomyxa schiedti]|nr:hypothetical protein Pelo_742 [Pelomyxa schiedti]
MLRRCAVESVENAKLAGGVYTGRLVNNKRDGRGKFTLQKKDGQHTYDGDWRVKLKHGRGTYTWPDGGTYDGEWSDGIRDGWGVECLAGGGRHEGLWRRGRLTRGTWHDPNGVDVKEGEWVWNESTNSYKLQGWGVWRKRMIDLGSGTYTEATGSAAAKREKAIVMVTVYEGEWDNGQRHGHGMWRSPESGTIWCGEWDHGRQTPPRRTLKGQIFRPSRMQLNCRSRCAATWVVLPLEEGDSLQFLVVNDTSTVEASQHQREPSQALSELNTTFKVATKLRSQLKNTAPLLVSLEESVSVSSLKQSLESATERNQELAVHLSELANLREALDKAVEESERRCKEILGQTLAVESSESEIWQCSRNISLLMQKLLGIKPSSSAINDEQRGTRPVQDINELMTLKPWLQLQTLLEQSPPSSSSSLEPLSLLLREITEGASRIQEGCTFDSCSKVIEQHTLFQKECDSQFTLCQGLHDEIGELFAACQGLNEGYSRKYMVMRGLEGDESFMSHPDVWHQLSELLPRAQQVVMDITLAKFTSGKVPPGSQQQAGCTASGSASIPPRSTTETVTNSSIHPQPQKQGGIKITSNTDCIVCDERPRNVMFHPCGHTVCCSECSSNVRKCPLCRAQIQHRSFL